MADSERMSDALTLPVVAEQELRQIFGRNIKTARNWKGWTQQELADNCQMQQSMVAKWENGKTTASTNSINTLARVFGLPPAWFYDPFAPHPAAGASKVTAKATVDQLEVLAEMTLQGKQCVVIDLELYRRLRENEKQLDEMREMARRMAVMCGAVGENQAVTTC